MIYKIPFYKNICFVEVHTIKSIKYKILYILIVRKTLNLKFYCFDLCKINLIKIKTVRLVVNIDKKNGEIEKKTFKFTKVVSKNN